MSNNGSGNTPLNLLANKMAGFRPETAHLDMPSFPGWEWLPFVRRGWKWELKNRGRLVAQQGMEGDPSPIIMRPGDTFHVPTTDENQPQWLIGVILIASSPFLVMKAKLDDFMFSASHWSISNIFGGISYQSNWLIKTCKPMLLTPFGMPFYTLVLDPVMPVSITSTATFDLHLPLTTPVTQIEVFNISIGRVIVNDYNVFLDEVRKTVVELEVGKNVTQWQDAESGDRKLIADIGPSGRRTL